MAIFGGVFALMLVFLLLVNLFSSHAVRERLDRASEHGMYRIERMDGGAGYVVIVFPEAIRIVETGAGVSAGAICDPGSAFVDYARRIYEEETGPDRVLPPRGKRRRDVRGARVPARHVARSGC